MATKPASLTGDFTARTTARKPEVVGTLRGKWYIWEQQISATQFLYGLSSDSKLPPVCRYAMLSSLLSMKDL